MEDGAATRDAAGAAAERSARIQQLAVRLLETEAELRSLTRGEIDAVLDPAGAAPLLLREAQEALRDAEARARELIARLPIIACELAPDGTVRFVNDAVTDILGFHPAELIGRNWWSAVSDGDRPPFAQGCNSDGDGRHPLGGGDTTGAPRFMLDGGTNDGGGSRPDGDVANVERVVHASDGAERVVVWSSKTLCDARGRPQSVFLFGLDLTERRRAEEAARELIREQAARAEAEASQRRAALLAEASRLLGSALRYEATLTSIARLAVSELAEYCIVDLVEPDGSVRRVDVAHPDLESTNALRETLAQQSPVGGALRVITHVIATGMARYVDVVDEVEAERLAERDVARELVGRSFACAPLAARGQTIGAITIISARDGRPFGAADFALFEELARRAALAVDNARLYEAALTASRAKSEFLAVMSHELRTPLNAILGYSDLMLLGVPTELPDPTLQQVQRVQLAARHLLDMINEILMLSRVEAGEETVQREDVELCAFLRETAALVEPLADSKRLQLRCETPDRAVHVSIDARKVRQILLNLLGNAVKFTHAGDIAMRGWITDDTLFVDVTDSGIGIAPEHLEHIFEPFWQVEQARSRRRDGTGLGLNVARRLARLMDGDIDVASRPGTGTRFLLWLPGVGG